MDINVEKYNDLENVTIAEFKEAIANAESKAIDAIKKKDLKTALSYYKVYFELQKRFGKKIKHGSGLGYKPRGNSK